MILRIIFSRDVLMRNYIKEEDWSQPSDVSWSFISSHRSMTTADAAGCYVEELI